MGCKMDMGMAIGIDRLGLIQVGFMAGQCVWVQAEWDWVGELGYWAQDWSWPKMNRNEDKRKENKLNIKRNKCIQDNKSHEMTYNTKQHLTIN